MPLYPFLSIFTTNNSTMDPRAAKTCPGRVTRSSDGSSSDTSGSYNTAPENAEKSEPLDISIEDYYSMTSKPHHTFGNTMLYQDVPIVQLYGATGSASLTVPAGYNLEESESKKPYPDAQPFCPQNSEQMQSEEVPFTWQLAKTTLHQDITSSPTARREGASRIGSLYNTPHKDNHSLLHTPGSTRGATIGDDTLSTGASPPHVISPATKYGWHQNKRKNRKIHRHPKQSSGLPRSPDVTPSDSPSPHSTLYTPQRQKRQTSLEGSNRKVSSGLSHFATPFVPSNTALPMKYSQFSHGTHRGEAMQYHNAYGFQGQGDGTSSTQALPYDPYTTTPSMTASDQTSQNINPYQDTSNVGGTAYYSGAGSYTQPVSNLQPSRT